MNEQQIFTAALARSPQERATFLHRACGGDQELQRRIELLLENDHQDSFFARPAADVLGIESGSHAKDADAEETIGPYRLVEQIGEGGMGVVYMADQEEPIKRRVALKVIKAGMDTRQVIARFEAERQTLALMDHPNIAKILDGGATKSGRPFFVMELVNGISIAEYCEEHQLSVRQRLELFVPICNAVQHAHQKGLIHRDLKPSNVLVAEYDGKAVPKVIDFGVAKALDKMSDKTIFTKYGQLVGTIEYMSPEQAQFNQLDIDTRSDIYSLGVLLFELLTGHTPFDKTRLCTVAFDEMLRIIREEDPPTPSTSVKRSQVLPSLAIGRRVEPKRLAL